MWSSTCSNAAGPAEDPRADHQDQDQAGRSPTSLSFATSCGASPVPAARGRIRLVGHPPPLLPAGRVSIIKLLSNTLTGRSTRYWPAASARPKLVTYPDLDTDAIGRLEVVDFPVLVVNDL